MTRRKNEGIGKAGEKRILKIIKEHTKECELHARHNGHPDIVFEYNKQTFAAECKTVAGIHKYRESGILPPVRERIGGIHIRRTEYEAMKNIDPSWTPCLIVEIRPPNKEPEDYIYIYVPWFDVMEEYERNRPEILSKNIWWVLKHGVRLSWYLDCLALI